MVYWQILKITIKNHWYLDTSNGLLKKIKFVINKHWDLNASNGLLETF